MKNHNIPIGSKVRINYKAKFMGDEVGNTGEVAAHLYNALYDYYVLLDGELIQDGCKFKEDELDIIEYPKESDV